MIPDQRGQALHETQAPYATPDNDTDPDWSELLINIPVP
jgi:hypothetical protein